MKIYNLLIIAGLLLLAACQKTNAPSDNAKKDFNHADAASYNTQLGLAYLKQGNQPRAKRKLLTALSQAPKSPQVNAAMAYFFEKTGNMDEAGDFYHKAMSLAPHSGAQLNNYGAFLCRQGAYQKADHFFLKAVKDVKYENTAGAYENAGLCALEATEYVKAEGYFKKALEQDSSRKQSLYELVRLEIKQNHYTEALASLQRHPALVLEDRTLLMKAISVAKKAKKDKLASNYINQLNQLNRFSDSTGVKNEYNNS